MLRRGAAWLNVGAAPRRTHAVGARPALRIPILGTQLGVAPAAELVGLLVVGLLLDIGRLKAPAR